jgi:hypothetical protein
MKPSPSLQVSGTNGMDRYGLVIKIGLSEASYVLPLEDRPSQLPMPFFF